MSGAGWDMGITRTFSRCIGLICLMLLAACTERDTAMRAAPHPDGHIQPVYVATTRPLDKTGPAFGEARARTVNYFRVDVSVPPTHEVGKIEWARGVPDASRHFVVTDTHVFPDGRDMIRTLQRATPQRDTLVFVHGYNNTLSEAMYRLAQIRADFNDGNPALLFSWPSAGDPRGYVYDRDSVLFARDDLDAVLQKIVATPGERIVLFAHSVGSQLTMEVLRQAALRGDRRLLDRIDGVVLMSPDIDPDLFRRQAEVIGKLPQPFVIFASKADRVLGLSALLSGRKPRLGVVDDPRSIEGLEVQLVDFTEVSDGQSLNHLVPVTSPQAVKLLKGLLSQTRQTGRWGEDHIVLHQQP